MSIEAPALDALKTRFASAGFVVTDAVIGSGPDSRPDIFVARDQRGVAVDVLIVKTPLEEEAVSRGVRVELLGRKLCVVTAEDLVFYKLLADGRAIWTTSSMSWLRSLQLESPSIGVTSGGLPLSKRAMRSLQLTAGYPC